MTNKNLCPNVVDLVQKALLKKFSVHVDLEEIVGFSTQEILVLGQDCRLRIRLI